MINRSVIFITGDTNKTESKAKGAKLPGPFSRGKPKKELPKRQDKIQ
jgi:hypothetical protein